VTVVQPAWQRIDGLVRWCRERPSAIYWLSVPLLAVAVYALLQHLGTYFLDLEVYRLGVQTWLAGGDPYGALPPNSVNRPLPFIYPPFAAIVMVPLAMASWNVAWVTLFLLSLGSLALTVYLVVLRLWPSGGRAGALAVGSVALPCCLALEPVLETFRFGQINLILMALVAADCLVKRPRWPRGALVGLAAAIKLTPAAFVLYFVLRRDWRAAFTAAVAGAVATGIGAVIAPGPSVRYWFGGLAGAGGLSGSPFYTNQTFEAMLTRAGVAGLERTAIWAVLSLGLLLIVVPVIRRAPAPLALVATGGFALLVSPTSWSHHWVWVVPAVLVAGVSAWRARSAGWTLVSAVLWVTFVVAVHQFLPHDDQKELTWSGWEQVVGSSYVLVAVGLFVAVFLVWRGRPVAGSGAVSGSAVSGSEHDPAERQAGQQGDAEDAPTDRGGAHR
jgi:alpha-1,2-mannosyltransferase